MVDVILHGLQDESAPTGDGRFDIDAPVPGSAGDFDTPTTVVPTQRGQGVLELLAVHAVERQHVPQAILFPLGTSPHESGPRYDHDQHHYRNHTRDQSGEVLTGETRQRSRHYHCGDTDPDEQARSVGVTPSPCCKRVVLGQNGT